MVEEPIRPDPELNPLPIRPEVPLSLPDLASSVRAFRPENGEALEIVGPEYPAGCPVESANVERPC